MDVKRRDILRAFKVCRCKYGLKCVWIWIYGHIMNQIEVLIAFGGNRVSLPLGWHAICNGDCPASYVRGMLNLDSDLK